MSRLIPLFLIAAGFGFAQDHWVATWTAAQQTPRAVAGSTPAALSNQTVRMIVRTTIGGRRLRLEVANTYGTAPLAVGAAHVAIRSKGAEIVPSSDRELMVNGKHSFTVPPGAVMLTDPVDLEVPKLTDLAVSVYVPGEAIPQTQHSLGLHTTYVSADGNQTGQPAFAAAKTTQSWYWLSSIEVTAPANASAVVAFGDSITDGFHSTPDTNSMWPSVLAQRLLAKPAGPQLAVVNEAISGNQILHDGAGVNALARFDHDILARPGVKWLVILEGINDIGRGLGPNASPANAVTTDDLIAGLRQMIDRAHAHGIQVIGATLTPYEGAAYFSDKGEMVRTAVNEWIRTGGAFDSVIDFDAATRNPDHAAQFRPDFDSGDHLHPNDAGYKAMAESINPAIFAARKP
ncbi:MAG TPA: SGNH/GDSL hydrolase family protein [Bryobacteraceae bacterium]|jgi:lysophospholipase L1-like esterase|nr:SGNH/GDSL hydrolase family protein [Bryobacteraceae bacterium]